MEFETFLKSIEYSKKDHRQFLQESTEMLDKGFNTFLKGIDYNQDEHYKFILKSTEEVFSKNLKVNRCEYWEAHLAERNNSPIEVFRYREWQANELKLVQIDIDQIVTLFMENFDEILVMDESPITFNLFNVGFKKLVEPTYVYISNKRNGILNKRPLCKETKYKCFTSNINDLSLSYEDVYKILELKSLNIFTSFVGLKSTYIRPIVLAILAECPAENQWGNKNYYFVTEAHGNRSISGSDKEIYP